MSSPIHPREKAIAAFHAAALGDSLGWPFESPRRRVTPDAATWTRTLGNRFRPVIEVIHRGEYSDDTQLILSTARSILRAGPHWPSYLAERELPMWMSYERGGGRATKSAVSTLRQSKFPWDTPAAMRSKYFDSGGNGAAMRILPHAVFRINDRNAEDLIRDVLLNGMLTHGHPRALLGAIFFALVIKAALRQSETLRYGELARVLRENAETVRYGRVEQLFPTQWKIAAEANWSGRLNRIWDDTIFEVVRMAERCLDEINRGALSSELEFLKQIGALEKRTNGSGTVGAVAAVFIASRYATDPIAGVELAAGTKGLDTDTIASMAGTLLGAINGADWISGRVPLIQDSEYIRQVASDIWKASETSSATRTAGLPEPLRALSPTVDALFAHVSTGEEFSHSELGQVQVKSIHDLIDSTGLSPIRVVKAAAFGGQTICFYVKSGKHVEKRQATGAAEPKVGVRFYTYRLHEIKGFYLDVLGLSPTAESTSLLRYGPNIVFAESRPEFPRPLFAESTYSQSLVFEVSSLKAVRHRLEQRALRSQITQNLTDRPMIVFHDPDGRRIEVFEFKQA